MSLLQEMVEQNIQLPSPPGIALRLLEALRNDEFSYVEIAGIIMSDPALTAKVLTVVNSAFYSLPVKTGNLERALSILGVNVVKNVALSFILLEGMAGESTVNFNLNYFWKRSITAAVSSELLAPYVNLTVDDLFVSSLLQDIGVFILYHSRPNDYAKLIDEKKTTGFVLETAEEDMFGFNHQDVSSEILEHWGLPENIYLPIRYHHRHEQAPESYRSQAKALYLSNRISSFYNNSQCAVKIGGIASMLGDNLGMCDSLLVALIDKVAERSLEIFSCFVHPPGEMRRFTQMLQEANGELSKLNFSYESLLKEMRQEKSKSEKLALQLNESNNRLREISFRDALTGLYNRKYLTDFMHGELSRSERYGSCFSLLLIDIDHFKKVNDTYGHQAGDLVLKAISKAAHATTRKSDIVARYGGEEFTVVLPETGLNGALRIAEQLREVIAEAEIEIPGHKVRVTISIGVTVCDMQKAMTSVDQLINTADKALYLAKAAGRNTVFTVMANEDIEINVSTTNRPMSMDL